MGPVSDQQVGVRDVRADANPSRAPPSLMFVPGDEFSCVQHVSLPRAVQRSFPDKWVRFGQRRRIASVAAHTARQDQIPDSVLSCETTSSVFASLFELVQQAMQVPQYFNHLGGSNKLRGFAESGFDLPG